MSKTAGFILLDGFGDIISGAIEARSAAAAVNGYKGISVIGPRATYREFAKKIGAEFLEVTNEEWTWQKNLQYLADVVKRGDDVVFAGKFSPELLDQTSILAREIDYLKAFGYKWAADYSKLFLPK